MSNEAIDFTLLNRLNPGDRVRVVASTFGEMILVKDTANTIYHSQERHYFYSFNPVEVGRQTSGEPKYGIRFWVSSDPSSLPAFRDKQIREEAKDASLIDLFSRRQGKILSLEKI